MAVVSCPPGLWNKIVERDGHLCAVCKRIFPERFLTIQHLINRAGANKALRWSPLNLLTVCSKCHPCITDERPDYRNWSVTKFGDQEKNLLAFWKDLGRDWRLDGIGHTC